MHTSCQHTLKKSIQFKGLGVHSGQPSTITIHPANANTGIVFVNASSPQQTMHVGHVTPEAAMHATVIKANGWLLSTVEHLLAALYIMDVDNATIVVQGQEIPILDGSALPFVQGILDVGLEQQADLRTLLTPRAFVSLADQAGRMIEITPAQKTSGDVDHVLHLNYSADFKHPLVGDQTMSGAITKDFFVKEVAPARTFGFLDQLPFLRQHNLAKGTSLGNTVVIGQELINDMRLPNECIRHKVLDLIGDLSLLGKRLIGTVKAHHTSHNFNRLVIEHYLKNPEQWELI